MYDVYAKIVFDNRNMAWRLDRTVKSKVEAETIASLISGVAVAHGAPAPAAILNGKPVTR